jgi:hypothetical protein
MTKKCSPAASASSAASPSPVIASAARQSTPTQHPQATPP